MNTSSAGAEDDTQAVGPRTESVLGYLECGSLKLRDQDFDQKDIAFQTGGDGRVETIFSSDTDNSPGAEMTLEAPLPNPRKWGSVLCVTPSRSTERLS
jgi:hypothetical protein